MNINTMWNRTEENILKEFWGRYPMDRIQEMLPNRSAGAIQNRVRDLGLNNPEKRLLQTQEQKSIAELESELIRRKLELEISTAEQQLDVFENNAVRDGKEYTTEIAKTRSKLAGRITQLKLRLFKLKLQN